MRNFDQQLRDALIDANLLQFETVLAEAGDRDYDFSPRYLRERMRMLADPFGWAKRQERPPGRRLARNIACVLLACTVAFGALMAASPSVRAAVLNWLRGFGEDTVTYSANPYAAAPSSDAALQDWQITWLPEDYVLQDFYISPSFSKWFFLSADSGGSLDFGCSAPGGKSSIQIGTVSNPEEVRESVSVQGRTADYYADSSEQLLIWETPEGFLLRLRAKGQLDRETLVRIAESAVCYSGSTPAYEIGWVPPDFYDISSSYGNGVFYQDWARQGVLLSWRYVIRPACPFAPPEGEAEVVTVNGLPGRFWASLEEVPEVPDGPDESIKQIGDTGVIVSMGVSPGIDTCSTLMWEDPETGAAFLLVGELERDDLLRMAESVQRKEAPIEPLSPGVFQEITGTAGNES